MKLMLVIGARPQIIKSAPIIHEALKNSGIELQIIHTGQHYDFEMSKIFFGELDLPNPLVNLGVGSGTHAFQTGRMMIGLEKTMEKLKPDFVLVPGDTNSTLAGALAAVKLKVPVTHVEAGARSYDMRMPEEINRRLTDHCSSLLFAPTKNCVKNLVGEGILKKCIRLSGDTMYDALLQHMPIAVKSEILKKLGLESEDYALLTLHRPENVDAVKPLKSIVRAMVMLKELSVVFPVHPRTRQRLAAVRLLRRMEAVGHVRLIAPVGYHDMLWLIRHARMVFTDSGGLQKEAFWLHTPCVTLRERTEWIETVELGANVVVGSDTHGIVGAAREILGMRDVKVRLEGLRNPFGDGCASVRILADMLKFR